MVSREDRIRIENLKKTNSNKTHHPVEKTNQIKTVMNMVKWGNRVNLNILELFAGRGNLTRIYEQHGTVSTYDKKYLNTGDSFLEFHRLIADKKKYDIIDLDPYGFPNRFFPDIFLLMEYSLLFVTTPKPYINCMDSSRKKHFNLYYGSPNPSQEEIILGICDFGGYHWRRVQLLHKMELGSIWRFAFVVKKIKARQY